jgi:tRNA U34 5-methylaminomethyl-2-thiouridine-forming methyltransferase MnmC
MPIPDRPTFATADPRWQCRITDDGSPTLVQTSTYDSMHSGCGALAETRHVYLVGSGTESRLATGQSTRVLELGFGTGLGWMVTAQTAIKNRTALHYLALESDLPPAAVIRQLDWHRFIDNRDLVDATIQWFTDAEVALAAQAAIPQLRLGNLTLEVSLGDAVDWCCGPLHYPYKQADQRFDAIYFDPFSPESTPRLWQSDIFATMHAVAKPDGRLASYCVNRQVRDAMQAAGWNVVKTVGPPGGKREVLVASRL